MTTIKKVHRLRALAVVALLSVGALGATGALPAPSGTPLASGVARADDGDDRGERRISRLRGDGRRACAAARQRTRGGSCARVVVDRDDRERYEVTVRRGSFRYEVDLSRSFRVLDVDRDRIGGGGDRDDDRDDRDDDDRDDQDDDDDDRGDDSDD